MWYGARRAVSDLINRAPVPMAANKGSYSVFEHTADIGLEVRAPSREALYETAAAAVFDIMFEPARTAPGQPIDLAVEVQAADEEELLVRWLAELVFLYDAEGLVLEEFSVSEISSTILRATVSGRPYDPSSHLLKTEIKAITYHALSVRTSEDGWCARFVIDV